ncbi:MAG: 1,2-diacylglycerol 3-alpha-glucosyltransferase [Actinomycetota bacterium]|nr:1,2-diacylglycerol 3-alpha-glucosyltransferase [Actinomycetota bacterium]
MIHELIRLNERVRRPTAPHLGMGACIVRIVMTNNFFLPRPSGSAHHTAGLARRLAEIGHDVLVVTAAHRGAPREEWRDGYRVVRLPSWTPPPFRIGMNYEIPWTISPRNMRELFRLLDEFRPDVVHQGGQFFDLTFMSAIWARRRKVPTVLTVYTALVHSDRIARKILWLGDMLLVRPFISIGRPTLVVIDTPIDSYVRRRYRVGDDRVATVMIGVEPDRFVGVDRRKVRDQLELGDRPIVLSLGHVIPLIRDRLALVRAMPRLIEKHPDLVVLVVGHIFDEAFLHLADELGVRDHLVCTGEVERDEVPAYVAASDVEAHDFHYFGLGTTTLEVMAAGVPVVSVVAVDNYPGLELRSGENITIVPEDAPVALANAIHELLEDRELATRVGKGQRQFVMDHFSMQAVSRDYLALYEKVAN